MIQVYSEAVFSMGVTKFLNSNIRIFIIFMMTCVTELLLTTSNIEVRTLDFSLSWLIHAKACNRHLNLNHYDDVLIIFKVLFYFIDMMLLSRFVLNFIFHMNQSILKFCDVPLIKLFSHSISLSSKLSTLMYFQVKNFWLNF